MSFTSIFTCDPPIHFIHSDLHLLHAPLNHILYFLLHFLLSPLDDNLHLLFDLLLQKRTLLLQLHTKFISRHLEQPLTCNLEALLHVLHDGGIFIPHTLGNLVDLFLKVSWLLNLPTIELLDLGVQFERLGGHHLRKSRLELTCSLLLVVNEEVVGNLNTQMSHSHLQF